MLTLRQRRYAAPALVLYDDPRSQRLANEHRKLEISLQNVLRSYPGLIPLGTDPLVRQLLTAIGFDTVDFVATMLLANGKRFTVVAVPTRIWRDLYCRNQLIEMKKEAKSLGTRSVLVPQRCIRGNTRAEIGRTLSRSRYVKYSDTQMDAVLNHVRRNRTTTIRDCATNIEGHDDPMGVVLLLCAQGILNLDRSRRISGSSRISIRL